MICREAPKLFRIVREEQVCDNFTVFPVGVIPKVVDFGDAVLIGEQMINRLGYTVYVADSGQSALELYEEKKDEIDVVLLDLVMPELSGEELFGRLREVNPSVKVILSSGYNIDEAPGALMVSGAAGFIQKPFNMAKLSKVLAAVLTDDH